MRRVFVLTLLASTVLLASGFARGPTFLDRPLDAWMSDLSDPNPEVRRGAAFALGKIGAEDADPQEVVDALTHSLHDKEAAVRDFAASALGDLLDAFPEGRQLFWAKTGPALQKELKQDNDPRLAVVRLSPWERSVPKRRRPETTLSPLQRTLRPSCVKTPPGARQAGQGGRLGRRRAAGRSSPRRRPIGAPRCAARAG